MRKSTKSLISFIVLCCMGCGMVGCKSQPGKTSSNYISAKPLTVAELGTGFKSDNLPDVSAIKQYSGKIDVCLDFEGTQDGWRALAEEYQRLQGKAVTVNINTNYSGSAYAQRLNNELTNRNTDWDIVEGNLGYGSTYAYCIDMYSAISANNPYCGKNVKWSSVLDPAAYRTKEADNSGVSIILNTEVMQTCWFVNDVALEEAGKLGYKNDDGKAEYPITWDDLISLCSYMQQAGYSNPLGITLADASVRSLQFSWLLRVYGDYYYRQFYKYIMSAEEWSNYDPTATVIETNDGYGVRYAKMLNMMFETDSNVGEGYIGFTSEVYRDFVSQLAKMKGYLMKDVSSTEFSSLRDKFSTQTAKDAPQIILDYQGFGIKYGAMESDSFRLGYFDYPQMISGKYTRGDLQGEDIVDASTITRDIGGNGGFVSIINHVGDSSQNDLNKDFVKFVMSPYGQTIYYKGLQRANAVPKGLTSVKRDLVVIPDQWKTFFDESGKTVTFSGDVDADPFLGWGIRYCSGYTETEKVICEYWRNLLMTGLSDKQTYNVDQFCVNWGRAVATDMQAVVAYNKWPNEFWKNPNYNL